MTPIFADTAYWIALVNPVDEFHDRAMELTAAGGSDLLTTQWVLTEFLDGYCGERTRQSAANFVRALKRRNAVEIVEVNADWFDRGLHLYEQMQDKEWSLTDCISILMMRERGVTEVLTADHHFEQAGFVALLK